MQFIIIARDYKNSLSKRLEVREEHIKLGDEMVVNGTNLYGIAMLDDNGQMCGSVGIFEFPSRKELDEYLAKEPYVTAKVWEKIEIIPCKVGPSHLKNKIS